MQSQGHPRDRETPVHREREREPPMPREHELPTHRDQPPPPRSAILSAPSTLTLHPRPILATTPSAFASAAPFSCMWGSRYNLPCRARTMATHARIACLIGARLYGRRNGACAHPLSIPSPSPSLFSSRLVGRESYSLGFPFFFLPFFPPLHPTYPVLLAQEPLRTGRTRARHPRRAHGSGTRRALRPQK
ncbi:hypothetical protein DFH07DRAFT_314100 [Mycena maculata]|uniref:Uncharacterized protein n=1 Tax=Mycena maculata TaxID=230809 RepID=A0AAD7HGU9_9AGAR|nr:hypothetical protein DFH07DRAFT_314100 [Mycena maculata]